MYFNLQLLLSLFLFQSASVRGLTVGSKPYAYAECDDSFVHCQLYGNIDLGSHVPEMISHYGRQPTNPTQTIKAIQRPHDVPSDIAEFLTDVSKTPFVKFPIDVIKYGKNVGDLEIRMNTSLRSNSISSLPNLVNLAIGNVQNISAKAVSDLPQLDEFELSNVNIKELPENVIYRCRNLKSIVIKDSTIESLSSKAFFSLYSVESLTMTGLKIGMFHDGPFVGMINLQNLVMTRSGITEVQSSWFKFLPRMKKLNLSSNQITSIDSALFRSLSNLKVLDLSHNQLTHLSDDSFAGLTKLESLDLSHNKLSALAPISALNHLTSFNQSYNNLLEASSNYFSSMEHLKRIDLRYNQINNFTVDSLENNYTLLINVAYLSYNHYNLILSQPTTELYKVHNPELNGPTEVSFGAVFGLTESQFRGLYGLTGSLDDTLMENIHCTCDWSWINENEININDYNLMATKECSADRGLMLYQYLYDTCNSTISYDFRTLDAPIAAPPAPKKQVLASTNEHVYDTYHRYSYQTHSNKLSDDQCKRGCQITYQ